MGEALLPPKGFEVFLPRRWVVLSAPLLGWDGIAG
jgi:hypothetical protein